jgi:hypothetical protein
MKKKRDSAGAVLPRAKAEHGASLLTHFAKYAS